MANNAKWFVVHTYSGYENKVASNIMTVAENQGLQDEILDVLVPTEIVRVPVTAKDEKDSVPAEEGKKRSRYKEVERKLFPGYVFVKAEAYLKHEGGKKAGDEGETVISMNDEAWYVIRNTRGVTGFVGPDGKPSPLSQPELERLGIAEESSDEEDIDILTLDTDDDLIDIYSIKVEVDFTVGDTVEIISGIFQGKSGKVKAIDLEHETVTVALSILGSDTPTECDLEEVKKVQY